MIKETAIVVSVESDALWVSTRQKSACHGCDSEENCGQGFLSSRGATKTRIRALLQEGDDTSFQPGDSVEIGVPEGLIVSATLLLYLLPLLTLGVGVVVANAWSGSDGATALGALAGLSIGGMLLRWRSQRQRNNPDLHPLVLAKTASRNLTQ